LEKSDKRLIGLYELGCCGGLSGLAIMITRAYFHWSGKCARRKMLLYIVVSSTNAFRGSSFNTLPVMRSYPGALSRLIKFISLHTSAGVNSRLGSDNCPGVSR